LLAPYPALSPDSGERGLGSRFFKAEVITRKRE
jgi:hypothetical protein